MSHLTFNLSRFIAFLCVHHPSTVDQRAFVSQVVFLYRARNTNASSRTRFLCWDFSHSENSPLSDFFHSKSLLCCGISLTQSPTKFSTPLLGFSPHSEVKSLHVPLMEQPPLKNNTTSLPNHPHAKSNILELKISTSRRHDRFRTILIV